MSTQLIINLPQVYTPFYLHETLELHKTSLAIGPLVIYVSGFLMTLLIKIVYLLIGKYVS